MFILSTFVIQAQFPAAVPIQTWIAVVGSVPVLFGLGPRTAMFMRAFYGNRPVERALMRTTLIVVPIQLGVILATGDPDAIGASAALSLVITTGVFAYQKRMVKRR